MLRNECRTGMSVRFGKPGNDEITRGIITKLNSKTAGVQTLDSRGRHEAGQVWRVSYALLSADDGSAMTTTPLPVETLTYNPFDRNNPYYELLMNCYNQLSPENLSCDGEASLSHMNQTRIDATRRIRGLCNAIGKNVTEDQIFVWWNSKREYNKAV